MRKKDVVKTSPLGLVAELHRRQGEMYAGGSVDSVIELLAGDIVDTEHRWFREVWLVPLDGDLFDRIWGSAS